MPKTEKKLYQVESAGLGTHYVVATGMDDAAEVLTNAWNSTNYGLSAHRRIVGVRLLAEQESFHNSETRLRIAP